MIAGMGRSGGGQLEIEDDGSWRVLLPAGERVGRFGGTLDGADLERLRAEVAAAAQAGAPARDQPWPAGGSVDTFWAGDVVAQATVDEQLGPDWAALAATCRGLLDAAPGSPLAAIEVSASGDGAVRHVGTEPVPTDGSGFSVEATLFAADSALLDSWSTTVEAPAGGEVPPGWEAALGLSGSGLAPEGDQTVSVTVGFAFVEGLPQPMSAWAST
jgi:hypothetical protein